MGETEDPQPTGDGEGSPAPVERPATVIDTLQVPAGKRRRIKSPTPGSIRGRSMTPIRGRSQTPFSLYLNRRSATPSTWRSITPFLKREDKERTPFELGKDIKQQLFCNKAVFDKALYMDITEPEVAPVRYITTDMSVIDRAAVMDVSNVEVIYVVEEYDENEEYTEDDESKDDDKSEEDDKKKKKKSKKKETKEKKEPKPKAKKERADKKEKSPSPKLTLKLELGGGPKVSKKMFDQPPPIEKPIEKPPPKKAKSKLALQMEQQAKEAAKAAEEAAKKAEDVIKNKKETFEERQKRLKQEEEERRLAEEEERQRELEAQLEAEDEERESEGDEDGDVGGESGAEEGESESREEGEEAQDSDDPGDKTDDGEVDDFDDDDKDAQKSNATRRGSASSEDDFVRPDPEDEERWKKIAEEEGEEFMLKMRKVSRARMRSEKERDADWQKHREAARLPSFVNFLTDRTGPEGNSIRLACAVQGPDLTIKWFKDGKSVERGPRHRINNNNNILSLEVMNTLPIDSGEYSCIISNANDEAASSCIVTVYEVFKDEPMPPTFSLIRDFYHLHDDELTIECHVHGTPRPRVKWIKDSLEISPSYKFTILEEAHGVYKLMIFRPSSRDSGKYICKAINDSGEEQITHNVVFAKPKKFHVHGIFRAHDELQKEKEEVAKRAMEAALKSKEEYDKRRGETRVSRYAVEEPTVPPKNKLKFAFQLRDRIANEGATVKLMCTLLGPDPAVRWLKDDKPIPLGPNVKNLSSENNAIIELKEVNAESSGVYKCIAKNQYNEVDTSCYLKVYSAQVEGDEQEPIFVLPVRDLYHSSENDLVVDTKVRGNPRPTITWLRDEVPLALDARIQQIEHLDGVCELIINKPTTKDSGNYTCIAENRLGAQKISHSVAVENIPLSRRSSASMSTTEEKAARPQAEDTASRSKSDKEGKPPAKGKKTVEPEETGRRRQPSPDISPKNNLYFMANLTNRYLPEGSKVKLSAVIKGPEPQIKWLKNGQNMSYGPRVRNLSTEGLAVLEIQNTNEEDSGEYTCIARNVFSEISTSAILHVYQAKASTDIEPVFTRALKDTYHLNTNELILESHVRGQPYPTVTWLKDSIELVSNEKYQTNNASDGTCQLIIDKPEQRDTGKYLCRAENALGSVEISHYVLFEGKASHIAENIHGVFHADPNLKKHDKPISDLLNSLDEEIHEEAQKGKEKLKGRVPKNETEVNKLDDKPTKEEKREKKIGIHFATKLRDRVIAEGSTVKLTCYVEGNEAQIRWLREEQPVQYGPKLRQSYREGLCSLEIIGAREEDSATYTCFAKDGTGDTTTAAKITVYPNTSSADVPPTFTRSIKDTYHGKLNELVLDCHVRGVPTPTISWIKDGVKIEPSEKYQQSEHDDGTCELIVNNPTQYDSGKYICRAENRAEKAEILHVVHLEAKDLRPGSFQGSPLREVSSKPIEEVNNEPVVEVDNKDATSEKAVAVEKGQGKKKKDKAQEESNSGRRNLPPPTDPKKKLHFATFLSNRTIVEGSNIRLSVCIEGPDPQVRWFRNDDQVVFGPKSKSSCQDGLAVLVLSNLTVEDSGEYKLIARNADSEIETAARINVYGKVTEDVVGPVFTVGIKDNYSLTENELSLDCRVRGQPRPDVTWAKDNTTIGNDDKYLIINQTDGYCKLLIRNATEKDSGIYTCTAENIISEEKIAHTVEFASRDRVILEKTHGFFHRDPNKPHFVAALGDHMVPTGGTIVIQAEFIPTTTPIEVQWLKNKLPISPLPNVKTLVDHGVYILSISNVTPEDTGTYTCRAGNAFGRTESNANVDIVSASVKGGKSPLFQFRPEPEMKIAVNDPFSLSFRVQGDPKPRLTLLKGTKDITKSERVSKEASDDDSIRFTIKKAQISDSGTYLVVARNTHGTDRLLVNITVRDRAHSSNPLRSGVERQFKCFSELYAPKRLKDTNFTSECANIERENDICILVKRHMRDLKCYDGDTVTLGCCIEGKPTPTIIWRKNGKELAVGGNMKTVYDGSSASLTIMKARARDGGLYACVGSNCFGDVNSSACLIVRHANAEHYLFWDHSIRCASRAPYSSNYFSYQPAGLDSIGNTLHAWAVCKSSYVCQSINEGKCRRPRFFSVPYGKVVEEGNNVRFFCVIDGIPLPWSKWDKDGRRLLHSEKTKIIEKEYFRSLEIECVTDEDSGLYRITIENDHGRTESTARLDVICCQQPRSRPFMKYCSPFPRKFIIYHPVIVPNTLRRYLNDSQKEY